MPYLDIERVRWNDFRMHLRDHVSRGRPIVVHDTPTMRFARWDHEYLRRTSGERVVQMVHFDSQHISYDDKKERTIVRLPVARYLDWLADPTLMDGVYNLGRSLIGNYPALEPDVRFPEALSRLWARPLAFSQISLWIGKQGIVSPLHFDTLHNLNFQIRGHKEWHLFSPRDLAYLYPHAGHSHAAHISRIPDSRQVDARRYPRFAQATRYRATTRAGEFIFVPYGWFHQVETVGAENINLNVWWVPQLPVLLAHWRQSLRGVAVTWHRRGQHPFDRFEARKRKRA